MDLTLQSAIFFMCLLDCHHVMDFDGMFSSMNRIQCSIPPPDMKTVHFQFIFQVEFLFVAITSGPGVLFKALESIKNNFPGLFRQFVDGIY